MYKIYWNTETLHNLNTDDYILVSPVLKEGLNKIAELKFTIEPTHPYFNRLEKLVPKIKVTKDNKTIFIGRVISEEQNINKTKSVTCESIEAFLLDSIQRPFSFQGKPLDLFTQIINEHNKQVEVYKQFKIGTTTGASLDTNDYINRSSESYNNTYDLLKDKILSVGGYIRVRYEQDGNYIDWIDDFKEGSAEIVSLQKIEFGENLSDLLIENDASEIYTAVLPLGAEKEQPDGTKTRVDIKAVNNGIDYIVNEVAKKKYGLIFAPVEATTWDDVTVDTNLLRKATAYLNNKAVMIKSRLELKAVDLNTVNKDIPSFKLGEYIETVSSPHGISKTFLLTEKETPLTDPGNTIITLGESKSTLTGLTLGNTQNIVNKVDKIQNDYKVNEGIVDRELDEIRQDIITNTSLIEQTGNEIRSEVKKDYVSNGTFNEFKSTTSTSLTQTNDKIEANFTATNTLIENIDGEVKKALENLNAYIRGYMNAEGKPVLELGTAQSTIQLKLLNDRIQFINNGSEVAYINNNKLFITDGEFLNSLKIGKFALVPRTNGNLTLKRVGGV